MEKLLRKKQKEDGKKGFRKLSYTMAFYCLVLALVLCLVLGSLGYWIYYQNAMENYRMYMESTLNMVNFMVDADDMRDCIATLTVSDTWKQTQEDINEVKSSTMVEFLYLVAPLDENDSSDVIYVCAAYTEQEAAEEPETLVYLGEPVQEDAFTEEMLEILNDTMFREAGISYTAYRASFGYMLTGVMPATDSEGNVVCLICVDFNMDDIYDTMYQYIIGILLGTAVTAAVVLFLTVTRMNRTVVSPIHRMAEEAGNFVGQSHASADPAALVWNEVKTERRDEIGMLNDSITNMMKDTVEYMQNLARVTAEKERIGAELDIAAHIQASMLPCIFPAFPEREEFEVFATMTPAKEVGGDFYDFFMVDETHLALVVADVSGKGIPAALFMVIGKTLIKDHTLPGRDLGEVFTRVNDLLCESNSEGLFITAFEGVLDLVTGEFVFVNAGHEQPFLCGEDGEYRPYKIRPGFVLAGMEGMRYRAGSFTMKPGDSLFQYTDGVTEATDADENLYGMERLGEVLNRCRDLSPTSLLPEVKADIDRFVGEAPQFDDITMLGLKFKKKLEIS